MAFFKIRDASEGIFCTIVQNKMNQFSYHWRLQKSSEYDTIVTKESFFITKEKGEAYD